MPMPIPCIVDPDLVSPRDHRCTDVDLPTIPVTLHSEAYEGTPVYSVPVDSIAACSQLYVGAVGFLVEAGYDEEMRVRGSMV